LREAHDERRRFHPEWLVHPALIFAQKEKRAVTRITAYIPAYNVSETLARAIEGLLAQTHPFDEILVIDDGSRDDSAEIVSRCPQVRLIRHPVNQGLPPARTTALRAARNELVASVDADVVADANWIASLAPHFFDLKVARAAGILTEGVQTTLADRWRRARLGQRWGPQYLRNPTVLYGSNTVCRQLAVMEMGGYDESFRISGDDTELDRRAGI
jgi:glycosyltransferase involved in cell wall biosynthesis